MLDTKIQLKIPFFPAADFQLSVEEILHNTTDLMHGPRREKARYEGALLLQKNLHNFVQFD